MKLNFARFLLIAFPAAAFAQTHISVEGGTPANRTILGVSPDGTQSALYGFDDGSGRQSWRIRPLGNGFVHIFVEGGTPSDRRFLSAPGDGTKVDLWSTDDGSGRQLWRLEPVGDGSFHIVIGGGTTDGRQYLSVTADGTKVDLWTGDDGSGRQRWFLDSPNATSMPARSPAPYAAQRRSHTIRFENRGAFQARFFIGGVKVNEVMAGQESEAVWNGSTIGVPVKGEYLGFAGWQTIFTGTLDGNYDMGAGDACVRVTGTAFKASFQPCPNPHRTEDLARR